MKKRPIAVYVRVSSAGQNLADPGGILFLKYGTFNEATPTLRLSKRLTITSVGRASIRPTGVAEH